jgi:hypothetical protein
LFLNFLVIQTIGYLTAAEEKELGVLKIEVYSLMAPRWHQGTIAPMALKNNKVKSGNVQNKSLFLGRFKGLRGHWEYVGTIGNGYNFAHAKHGGNL